MRSHDERLANIPQAIWRSGVSQAHSDINAWEKTNERHGRMLLGALDENRPIPRAVQRRAPRPTRLFRTRKQRDKSRRNHCRVLEGVRKIDAHTIQVPGIGRLRVRNKIAVDVDPRAVVIRERTPAARRRDRKLREEERTWTLYLHHQTPAPKPREPGSSVGGDHGVVYAVTTADDHGNVRHYAHEQTEIGVDATGVTSNIKLAVFRAACETPGACGLAQSSMLLVNAHWPWFSAWMPGLEDPAARREVAVGCFDVFSAAGGDTGG